MNRILIAGAPRSGTTFVGRVLAHDYRVNVLVEPFNPDTGMPDFPVPFAFARSQEDARILGIEEHVRRAFAYDYHAPRRHVPDRSKARSLLKSIVGNRASWSHKIARINVLAKHTIIKDPTASLMAPYLAACWGVKTIFMVRHPLSFYSSFKRLNWSPERHLKLLIDQPLLAEYLLPSFPEFDRAVLQDRPASAAWMWRLINEAHLTTMAGSDASRIVLHEIFSADPLNHFEQIAFWAGLPLGPRQRRLIGQQTANEKAGEVAAGVAHDMSRNSAQIFDQSVSRLSAAETDTITQIAGPTVRRLYAGTPYETV